MRILYFAWLRQKIGRGEDVLDVPLTVKTVEQLVQWLRDRGPEYQSTFAEDSLVRVAVNQVHVERAAAVANGDEVAFFPPVTGG